MTETGCKIEGLHLTEAAVGNRWSSCPDEAPAGHMLFTMGCIWLPDVVPTLASSNAALFADKHLLRQLAACIERDWWHSS